MSDLSKSITYAEYCNLCSIDGEEPLSETEWTSKKFLTGEKGNWSGFKFNKPDLASIFGGGIKVARDPFVPSDIVIVIYRRNRPNRENPQEWKAVVKQLGEEIEEIDNNLIERILLSPSDFELLKHTIKSSSQ